MNEHFAIKKIETYILTLKDTKVVFGGTLILTQTPLRRNILFLLLKDQVGSDNCSQDIFLYIGCLCLLSYFNQNQGCACMEYFYMSYILHLKINSLIPISKCS